jgi:hypothetical protein
LQLLRQRRRRAAAAPAKNKSRAADLLGEGSQLALFLRP